MATGSVGGRHRMLVGFTTTCAFSASCEFEHGSWRGVLDATVCDKQVGLSIINQTNQWLPMIRLPK